MIAPEFLSMLVCPSSRQPLREATAAELAAVATAIAAGTAKNRGGATVAEAVEAGLVPMSDGDSAATVLYPIRDGIPILLTAEAILLTAAAQ